MPQLVAGKSSWRTFTVESSTALSARFQTALDSIDEKLQAIFDSFQPQTKESGCDNQRFWYYSGPRSIVSRLATAHAMDTGQLALHFEARLSPRSPEALHLDPEAAWLNLWARGLL